MGMVSRWDWIGFVINWIRNKGANYFYNESKITQCQRLVKAQIPFLAIELSLKITAKYYEDR